MKVKDVKARVESEVDNTIDGSNIVPWIDAAQLEIAKSYGKIATTEVVAAANTAYALPNDLLKVDIIENSLGKQVTDYTVSKYGRIKFPIAQTYTIYYHKVPTLLPPSTQAGYDETELEVHRIFELAVILWCKAEFWEMESDSDRQESQFADKFRGLFYHNVSEGTKILNARETGSRIEPSWPTF